MRATIDSVVNWDAVTASLIQGIDLLRSQEKCSHKVQKTRELVGILSVSAITHHMQKRAPHLFGLLSALTLPPVRYQSFHTESHHHRKDHEKGAVFALSTLMKFRRDRALIYIACLCSEHSPYMQVTADFNHVGVAASYCQTWSYLQTAAKKEDNIQNITKGQTLWVYNNINIKRGTLHERGSMSIPTELGLLSNGLLIQLSMSKCGI